MTSAITPETVAAALGLAARGFDIVSLWSTWPNGTCRCRDGAKCTKKPGKHPIAPDGIWHETHDPARIRALLSAGSHPNFGAIPPIGCFGLDVDGPAVALVAELEAAHGPLPATYEHITRNGRHAFYRWPAEVERPAGGNLFGIVTRWSNDATGRGYVVAPGSRIGDFTYTSTGDPGAIADLPIAWARAAGERDRQPRPAFEDVQTGGRHEELRDAARYLRGRGLTGPALRAAVDAINAALPEPKTAAEVSRAIGNVETKFSADPPDVTITGIPKVSPERAASCIDAADLLALDLPPLRMIVPDLLPEGTTVIASPPKVGKSCLVYQIAVEVALGGELLGRRVEPGAVLYLALEDGARRGQSRLRAALGNRTMPSGRLEVRWSAPPIGGGLEEELVAWLDTHPDAAVVAIDTLQRVRQATNGKRGAYEVDVDDLGRLQALFRDRRVALLIVHHSRKASADDFLASVSGTYGITGSADTIVVVKRLRLEAFGTIDVTGRDVPEAEIPVRFDGMLWHSAPAALPEASFERQEVYRVIADQGPIFPAAIAKALDTTRQNVQNMVTALHSSGAIARTSGGWEVVRPSLISPVSLMYGGDIADTGDTRARQAPPVNLWEAPRRIFADDLLEPEEVDAAIASAFPWPGASA